jgi:hypothetical protein
MTDVLVSKKDQSAPLLKDVPVANLPDYGEKI